MQEKLRKNETSLLISGMADIAFGAWSLIKTMLYALLNRELRETVPEELAGSFLFYAVLIVMVLIIGALDTGLRLYVGLSARAEGKGKVKGRGYLIAAFVLAVLLLFSIGSSLYHGYNSVDSAFDTGVAILLDLTSLGAVAETICAALTVRKLRKVVG